VSAQWVISLNLVLAGLRLGLKNRQVGEKWVSDDCSYLCKGLYEYLMTLFQIEKLLPKVLLNIDRMHVYKSVIITQANNVVRKFISNAGSVLWYIIIPYIIYYI
jgi:hypothetical protein